MGIGNNFTPISGLSFGIIKQCSGFSRLAVEHNRTTVLTFPSRPWFDIPQHRQPSRWMKSTWPLSDCSESSAFPSNLLSSRLAVPSSVLWKLVNGEASMSALVKLKIVYNFCALMADWLLLGGIKQEGHRGGKFKCSYQVWGLLHQSRLWCINTMHVRACTEMNTTCSLCKQRETFVLPVWWNSLLKRISLQNLLTKLTVGSLKIKKNYSNIYLLHVKI